jgi:6-phosphogluconolactonase/glucosamine-6-phosphate isomerase/deaminase
MLSGGRTPVAAYAEVAQRGFWAAADLHVLLSDERMVPEDSPDSNLGGLRPMLNALEVEDDRILRVDTSVPLKKAAAGYDRALQQFVRSGGRITLGILGLGPDGHTASLFSPDDLTRAPGALAVAVPRREGPDRVSVTPDLLKRVEVLIFLVMGRDKQDVVSRLMKDPDAVVAGRAVREAAAVQLWTA